MPKIYNYHPETGELISEGFADPDPLQPGCFLIPASATTEPPPQKTPGKTLHMVDGRWRYRDIPPPPSPPAQPVISADQVRRSEILTRLAQIDAVSIGEIRDFILNGKNPAPLTALDKEAGNLRAELKTIDIRLKK